MDTAPIHPIDPCGWTPHRPTPCPTQGPAVQNLTADGSSIALPIPLGGHHLDLYFPTPGDPASVIYARAVEERMIRRWCQAHYDSMSASREPGRSIEGVPATAQGRIEGVPATAQGRGCTYVAHRDTIGPSAEQARKDELV